MPSHLRDDAVRTLRPGGELRDDATVPGIQAETLVGTDGAER